MFMTFKFKLVITERGAFIMADKEELTRLKRKIVAVDKLVKNKQRLVRGNLELGIILSCFELYYILYYMRLERRNLEMGIILSYFKLNYIHIISYKVGEEEP